MNRTVRLLLIFLAIVAPFAGELMAQPPIGDPPPCWPPPCIPIDGGLTMLIAAGAILGGKKALDQKRSEKQDH